MLQVSHSQATGTIDLEDRFTRAKSRAVFIAKFYINRYVRNCQGSIARVALPG